jgi:hypothetical protein
MPCTFSILCVLCMGAMVLGEDQAGTLSPDAEALVPLGVAAANSSAPTQVEPPPSVELPDEHLLPLVRTNGSAVPPIRIPPSESASAFAAASAAPFQPSNMLRFWLEPGESMAFFEDVPKSSNGWTARGAFVASGAESERVESVLSAMVRSPSGSREWEVSRRQSGAWLLKVVPGVYELRFVNPLSVRVLVAFGWVVGGDGDDPFWEPSDRQAGASEGSGRAVLDEGTSELVASMARRVTAIHQSLDAAGSELQTHSVRFARNQQTVESTEWRLQVYKVAQMACVVVLAITQAIVVARAAATSLSSLEDPRRRTHTVGSRRFAPRGLV